MNEWFDTGQVAPWLIGVFMGYVAARIERLVKRTMRAAEATKAEVEAMHDEQRNADE